MGVDQTDATTFIQSAQPTPEYSEDLPPPPPNIPNRNPNNWTRRCLPLIGIIVVVLVIFIPISIIGNTHKGDGNEGYEFIFTCECQCAKHAYYFDPPACDATREIFLSSSNYTLIFPNATNSTIPCSNSTTYLPNNSTNAGMNSTNANSTETYGYCNATSNSTDFGDYNATGMNYNNTTMDYYSNSTVDITNMTGLFLIGACSKEACALVKGCGNIAQQKGYPYCMIFYGASASQLMTMFPVVALALLLILL